ncbi:GTPase HflX [Mariprofundus erugo]|uniref:GTPase HflX n=1 Tax=Mariprofundus erugo TaxID=2528639 RepID=A0A5R9GT81_9PROT|nr:GTPase HflX [Mariprofundus erugo]TLS67643.1 GTPase HflX [Mariprofundus erugo]TLS73850.1 GTPase HflX [Mariprofundus erugo]
MSSTWETGEGPDLVITVHPELANRRLGEQTWKARAEEFDRLVDAAACVIVLSRRFPVRKAVAGMLLGEGQVEEIARQVEIHEAAVVFVDHPLTPVQQRNLEKAWNAKVVDRTGLILEIFAARARTREGVLQVELASLNYQLGRLVRSWTHLERQRGGFGFMGGPGERQIELDRRMIKVRISALERDLEKVRRMRSTQRSGRKRKDIPTVALVGYTNAGKSTLFNRLTESGVYVADQLFATLDPTLRLLELPGGLRLMLSDTVGFVQELPHELVDAFRATLEEVIEADLILHVRDASDPMQSEQANVVHDTLHQLGVVGDDAPPVIELLNKKDRVEGLVSFHGETLISSRLAISALSGEGIDELKTLLCQWLGQEMNVLHLRLDVSDGRSLAYCHEHGVILSTHTEDEVLCLSVRMGPADAARFDCDGDVHFLKQRQH